MGRSPPRARPRRPLRTDPGTTRRETSPHPAWRTTPRRPSLRRRARSRVPRSRDRRRIVRAHAITATARAPSQTPRGSRGTTARRCPTTPSDPAKSGARRSRPRAPLPAGRTRRPAAFLELGSLWIGLSELIRRQLRPPRAERFEGVPKLSLLFLLVERRVDVGDDECADRGREPLQFSQPR